METSGRMIRKTFRYLREKGLRETVRRAGLHFGWKRAERRFVARINPPEQELEKQRGEVFPGSLRFSIAVPLFNTPVDLLDEMICSVRAQTYRDWELCLADGSDGQHAAVGEKCRLYAQQDSRIRYVKLEENGGISENTNVCLSMASGDYIALFDHDDLLLPNALFEMRAAIDRTGADFLYSDEMVFQHPHREKIVGIRVKPEFSPDSLLTNNYICHLTVFSKTLLEKAGRFRKQYDGSQDHDLVLRLTAKARKVAHVPKVLYLWRAVKGSVADDINSKQYAIEAGRSAVRDFLREEKGIRASVESTEVFPTMYRVRYPVAGTPAVRVIIDARRDREQAGEKIRRLRETAGWERCGWTVITASGEQKDSRAGVSAIKPEKDETRRALWNRAAEAAEEEYLLFLDGFPEPAENGWLLDLLSYAQLDHVGAVGAKLLLDRGSVRHAGVVIGMGLQGLAGRPYFMVDGSNEGYFGQMAVTENVSAVTDCLMVSRRKWDEAGRFAREYGDALFDVDLCLRLLGKGYFNLFTPHARMILGKARDVYFDVGKEYRSYPRDASVFRQRNACWLERGDPFYHPCLSLRKEDWRFRIR